MGETRQRVRNAMNKRSWRTTASVALVALASGCMQGPLLENPLPFANMAPTIVEKNPVWVPLGPPAYAAVFERVFDALSDYYDIEYSNRYAGMIRTYPKVSPGLEQPWKPGSPDFSQRLLATLQTIRSYAIVQIQTAEDGGFFVDVKVYKELEDLPRPIRSTAGAAAFRSDETVERQQTVVEPTMIEANWIPIGRDVKLEQVLLQKIKQCL
jgi:hypothetical protein